MLFPYKVINQAVMWLCVGGVDTNPYLSWSINLYYGFLLSMIKIQGDPNQNLLFQLALSLNAGIPDAMLVKPKCV